MTPRRKKILAITLAILVVLGGGLHWFFNVSPTPAHTNFTFDWPEIRRLAAASPGARATRVNAVLIGEGAFPHGAAVAGAGLFHKLPMVFTSYQVVYPDSTVIIDTAHDAAIHHDNFGEEGFHQPAFDAMQTALRRARLILITHEHLDHIGGISRSPYMTEIAAHTMLTREQIDGPSIPQARFPEGALEKFQPLEYERYFSPAPGLVLIKAAGHSTGTQMIYLVLQDGREYLFLGDIVWNMENIKVLTGRPRLVSMLFLKEDYNGVAHQIKALADLNGQPDNRIQFVVAHDRAQFDANIKSGAFGSKFE